MCNLYNVTKGPQAILDLARAFRADVGNMAPGDIYPDLPAPIVRTGTDGQRELVRARWGMPSSRKALLDATVKRADKLRAKGKPVDDDAFKALLRTAPDSGVTNIRNLDSAHWRPWTGVESRCLVPATAFSEYSPVPNPVTGRRDPIWFALDGTQPLFFFAGVWTRWTSVRKVREGEVTIDIFAFLTCEPNGVVAPIHPKAMPVILTSEAERETWMSAPWADARRLQRPLPDDQLVIVGPAARTA